jgi:hypothetical protein
MKKIYTLLSILLISGALMAQVKVTFMVDITKYLAAGTPLGANGIRIGGDFDVTEAMNGETAMTAWSPSYEASALVNLGDSVWSITVTYPATSIGLTQSFKFVNNDWGTNEGTDPTNTIVTGGCGTADGGGNINRSLVIPATDTKLLFCWDACTRCNGNDPIATGLKDRNPVSALALTPNPVSSSATIRLNLQNASNVDISILTITGQNVLKIKYSRETAGNHTYNLDVSAIPAGIYLYRVVTGGSASSGNFVKL